MVKKKRYSRLSNEIYRSLGDKLRLARLSKGLTGDEVGRHLGISEQQTLKYERNEARMPIDRLIWFAELAEMPLAYFLGDHDVSGTTLSSEDAHQLVRSTGDLVSLWQRVPTPERAHLLAVIRNAAEG